MNDVTSKVESVSLENTLRQKWMAVIARASLEQIKNYLNMAPALPSFIYLRPPETGLIMVRGRIGGGGDVFNLGEATVTRCSIRDDKGRIGHAYIAGRDEEAAQLAARLDAALQDPEQFAAYQQAVVEPIAEHQNSLHDSEARRTAATTVDFFNLRTMRS